MHFNINCKYQWAQFSNQKKQVDNGLLGKPISFLPETYLHLKIGTTFE